MDPRDPRNREEVPPGAPLDPLQQLPPVRADEELTELYGPPAPEPAWDKPVKPFNREKFLLYLVAWILGVQFGLLILAGFICGYGQVLNFSRAGPDETMPPACPNVLERIKESAAESLAVLLALLGGGTIAVGEYQRRHPPGDDPRNPRR